MSGEVGGSSVEGRNESIGCSLSLAFVFFEFAMEAGQYALFLLPFAAPVPYPGEVYSQWARVGS